MALLTTTTMTSAGLTPATVAASAGGDTIAPANGSDDRTFLYVNNGSASSITVTVADPCTLRPATFPAPFSISSLRIPSFLYKDFSASARLPISFSETRKSPSGLPPTDKSHPLPTMITGTFARQYLQFPTTAAAQPQQHHQ